MGKLDSLRIDDSPLAFAGFAAKHNALVDLLAGMVGQNGIDIVMAEKNAIIRANIAAGPAGNVAFSNVANVVGSDGRLQNVYAGAAIANAYPTKLQVVNGGTAEIFGTAVVIANASYAVSLRAAAGEGLYIQKAGGATYLYVQESAITRDMTVREIDVCSGGVAKKMLVIASAAY
jgi:hypothetical protein